MGKNSKRREQRPSAPVVAPPAPVSPAAVEPAGRRLFTPVEWMVAGLAFLVSGGVYFYYMSPSVTLQDSGELVTGAFNFGVPHPTGYPLWAFLGWLWRHLVPFGNPAWRIGLFSVVTGAALVGILTLLMSRSILMLLRNSPWGAALSDRQKEMLGLALATTTAMMFAFNRGVWQWACVPEMRALNAFSYVATSCILFAWVMKPQQHRYLYALLLVWGLSLANHQTIIVMFVPFVIGMWVVGFLGENRTDKQRYSGLMEFGFALLVAWMAGVLVNAWLLTGPGDTIWTQQIKTVLLFGPRSEPMPVVLLAGGSAAALLLFGMSAGMLNWKRALICAGVFLLALSLYAYMPVAASTNPPMNWGYASTKAGFLHAITRGQYEQLRISMPWTEKFWIQMGLFVQALLRQYGWVVGAFAVVPFVALFGSWDELKPRARQWLIYSIGAFLVTWIGLIIIINPDIDKTQQEINLKFFVGAHGFFAMLIGYGLALTIAWALTRWPKVSRPVVINGSWGLVALAAIPFAANWAKCEQRNHDFGYQFGYRMFNPGGEYPPMERDAFLFGGTDPGRFVPTYMIFCESRVAPRDRFRDPDFDRRDVYIVTQNALADSTYMSYIRDHYDYSRPNPTNEATLAKFEPWQRAVFKWAWRRMHRDTMYPVEPLWIPTEQDSQRAFQVYVAEVQARRARGEPMDPEEDVQVEGGRVQVRGVKGVMKINGILCQWIHDNNKAKHAFYIEESYVIDWMYPYLEPYGIIMKINAEKLPTPQQNPALWSQLIARDKAYWDQLVEEFTQRAEFWRDNDARKTFSKLRSAIGGIYAYRRLHAEAEYAFGQALRLCPDSPEANFRLAQLLIETGRPDAAVATLEAYQKLDPLNAKIRSAIQQIRNIQQHSTTLQQLEQMRAAQPRDLQLVAQLAQAYVRLQQFDRIPPLFDNFLAQPGVTAHETLQIAQYYLQLDQGPLALRTLEQARQRYPQDAELWYALAMLRGATGATNEAVDALQQALRLQPALRDRARADERFAPLRNDPRFQALVAPPP